MKKIKKFLEVPENEKQKEIINFMKVYARYVDIDVKNFENNFFVNKLKYYNIIYLVYINKKLKNNSYYYDGVYIMPNEVSIINHHKNYLKNIKNERTDFVKILEQYKINKK